MMPAFHLGELAPGLWYCAGLTHRHDFKGHLMDGAIINVVGHTCAFYCFEKGSKRGLLFNVLRVFPFVRFFGTFLMNATKNILANTNN